MHAIPSSTASSLQICESVEIVYLVRMPSMPLIPTMNQQTATAVGTVPYFLPSMQIHEDLLSLIQTSGS